MALVTFKEPVQTFRGKLGAAVYTMRGAQGLARNFVRPKNPKSAPQVEERGYFVLVSALYSTLARVTVNAWQAVAAQVVERVSPTGTPIPWTGRSLFQACNVHRCRRAVSTSTVPPAYIVCPPPPAVNSIAYSVSGKRLRFNIKALPAELRTGMYRLLITPPTATTAAKARETDLRCPTADETLSYVDASDDTILDFYLTNALAAEFAASTTLQFGYQFQPLSADYVPNATPLFQAVAGYTKS